MFKKLNGRTRGIFSVIIYGCLWGLLELTLGGYLHFIHHPAKGNIMTSVGYFILAAYVIRHRTFWHPLIIGCIAASFKFFNVFIFSVPIFSRGIVNPALSIIIESAIVSIITFVALKAAQTEPVKRIVYKLFHRI